jgi:hypothetical protein
VFFDRVKADFAVSNGENPGEWIVRDLVSSYETLLIDVEKLQFSPGSNVQTEVSLDISGTPSVAYRLYKAAFARDPDLGGLGYWISILEQYLDPTLSAERNPFLLDVAKTFVESPEFKSKYGDQVDNDTYITNLYLNALGRAPDPGGFTWWKNNLDAGFLSRSDMFVYFSESEENKASVATIIATGVEYVPFTLPGT